ncbi:MAG: nucleotidyltransferase domain-containing protein [Lachnospiraceae bacterium]|nr:nucleotidyltransferase domain-containing protein [Lachnospiraceae bacterium]
MLSDDIKQELVQGLTDIFQKNISMIILYGSVARGEATDSSDIDIAVIVKEHCSKDRGLCKIQPALKGGRDAAPHD